MYPWTFDQTGLTDEEYNMLNLLKYDILSDEKFNKNWYDLTNAFHLIQGIFIQRALIRLTGGTFWKKFDLPYEQHEVLIDWSNATNYETLIEGLYQLHKEFQELEPFHPSHLDDLIRGINTIVKIIKEE